MITIEDGRKQFYQWDLGQRLLVEGYPGGTQVHFASRWADEETALITETYEEQGKVYVNVPNSLLQSAGELCVYIYVEDEADGAYTDLRVLLTVSAREKPDDYVYTETEVMHWQDLEAKVNETAEACNAAITTANTAAQNANAAADAAEQAKSAADQAAADAAVATDAAIEAAAAVGDAIDGIIFKDLTGGISYLTKFRLVNGKPVVEYTQIG